MNNRKYQETEMASSILKRNADEAVAGRKNFSIHTVAGLGLMLALAVILGYVEAILPLSVGIPGIKLGLANCAVLFILYRYGFKEAVLISALRTVIIAFLFTNLAALLYSLSGAVLSLIVMRVLRGSHTQKNRNDSTETIAADQSGGSDGKREAEKGFRAYRERQSVKGGFSIYGISAAGGVAHNIAQLTVAYFILGTSQVLAGWLTLYLPTLLVSGLAAGIINALIADHLLRPV